MDSTTEPPIPNDTENNNEGLDQSNEGDSQKEHMEKAKETVETSLKTDGNNIDENNEAIENNDADEKKVNEVEFVTEGSRNEDEKQTDVKSDMVENNKNGETNQMEDKTSKETNEAPEYEGAESTVVSSTTVAEDRSADDKNADDKNPEEMDPDELRRKISECKLKSDTLQIELDMAHSKNLDLEEKVKTMSENRKKSSESMSSTEAREKAKQRDGLAFQADYLARELSQQQNTETYLREKLTETLEEKEELERKNKDLQLRLKRFTKDDQAKDERIAKMEKELYDINTEVQEMEKLVDQTALVKIHEMRQSRSSSAPNGESLPQTGQTSVSKQQTPPSPTSKTCTIL